jgi:hypothetical protein
VEEVFIMRGGSRSGMACAFIRYASQDMALQAIEAIHGNITLPDANEPLVVRWADTPGSRGREPRAGRGLGGKRGMVLGDPDRRGAVAGNSYGVGMGSMLMQPNAYAYTPAYVPVPAPVQARPAPSSRLASCRLLAVPFFFLGFRADAGMPRALHLSPAPCPQMGSYGQVYTQMGMGGYPGAARTHAGAGRCVLFLEACRCGRSVFSGDSSPSHHLVKTPSTRAYRVSK